MRLFHTLKCAETAIGPALHALVHQELLGTAVFSRWTTHGRVRDLFFAVADCTVAGVARAFHPVDGTPGAGAPQAHTLDAGAQDQAVP